MISFLILTALGLGLCAQGNELGALLILAGMGCGFYSIHRREMKEKGGRQ